MKALNLTGQIFGRLTVIGAFPYAIKRKHWLCECECGNTKLIPAGYLTSGDTRSCGCLRRDKRPANAIDLTGQRFGRLIALSYDKGIGKWKCLCDCGKTKNIQYSNLYSGTKSCGCLQRELMSRTGTHRKIHTPEYGIWCSMKARCYNQNTEAYHHYGGRGITVYEPWINDFAAFFAYVGSRPTSKHTLDRLDNNSGYQPGNVAWHTYQQQANNKRLTRFYTYNGETKSLKQWAEHINIDYHTLYTRVMAKKWEFVKAITTPVRKTCLGEVAVFTTNVKRPAP